MPVRFLTPFVLQAKPERMQDVEVADVAPFRNFTVFNRVFYGTIRLMIVGAIGKTAVF